MVVRKVYSFSFFNTYAHPNIVIVTDRVRERRNDPTWEQNEDVRLSPESIAKVRYITLSHHLYDAKSRTVLSLPRESGPHRVDLGT